jgi:hypothetical protein
VNGGGSSDLDAVLADPASVPVEQIPVAIGELERVKAVLLARLTPPAPAGGSADRLLTVDEAAARLSVTPDWLRRRPELPFVVKLSEGVVRYSSLGIDRYIAARVGRAC